MATFVAVTASNCPRLKDAVAAQAVLDRFVLDGDVTAVIRTDDDADPPYLAIYGCDWPSARKIPEDVDRERFEPDYNLDGGEGFEEFLKAIAAHLLEPLNVQACGYENCRFPISVCEWHVRPGANKIEINGFKHSRDEPSPASC